MDAPERLSGGPEELKTFYDGTRKANLDVEIAVDMLSLAGRYDTAVLVSGNEDFVYAINAVAYKGCRVEVAGFRSNTAPRLIDVADFFIDLGDIAELIRKDITQAGEYEIPSFVPPKNFPWGYCEAAGRNLSSAREAKCRSSRITPRTKTRTCPILCGLQMTDKVFTVSEANDLCLYGQNSS